MKIAIRGHGDTLKWIDSSALEINGRSLDEIMTEQTEKIARLSRQITDIESGINRKINKFIVAFMSGGLDK